MANEKISGFIDSLLSRGRFTFTLDEARYALDRTDAAVKASLFRIVKKGLAVAVRKGFYVIVPPEYRVRGILPPVLFADDLMRSLNSTYYAGLLSAAALHGAGHQQPQDFYIVTPTPARRGISAKGTKIHFMSRRHLPAEGIEDKKTDTGIIRVSTPELTALDLVLFEKRIGGIKRVAEVLSELVERINPVKIGELAKTVCPISVVQRLGYIMENAIERKPIADALFTIVQDRPFFPVPLATGKASFVSDEHNRWKIRVDRELKLDT
jgi:predicted transcriptional regulator of viral defense system